MALRLRHLLLILTASASLIGCRTPRGEMDLPVIPDAPEMYAFPNSTHFQGFIYDKEERSLTVIPRDGKGETVTHYGIRMKGAVAFANNAGHYGSYLANVVPLFPTVPLQEVGGKKFLPIVSDLYAGVHYDEETREFLLMDKDEQVIGYKNVPIEVYDNFLKAPVKNAYHKAFIEAMFEPLP